jgi:hypothetical protein
MSVHKLILLKLTFIHLAHQNAKEEHGHSKMQTKKTKV